MKVPMCVTIDIEVVTALSDYPNRSIFVNNILREALIQKNPENKDFFDVHKACEELKKQKAELEKDIISLELKRKKEKEKGGRVIWG